MGNLQLHSCTSPVSSTSPKEHRDAASHPITEARPHQRSVLAFQLPPTTSATTIKRADSTRDPQLDAPLVSPRLDQLYDSHSVSFGWDPGNGFSLKD